MGAKLYPRGRTAASKPQPWYKRNGGALFQRDDGIVRAYYPGLTWTFDQSGLLARLHGSITIVEAGGIGTPVATRLEFPSDYPASEPVAFETEHRFEWEAERHIFETSGQCCLWLAPFSKWRREDPEALRAFLDELAVFFDRQLVFDATKRWPGPAWDHNVFGYWQFAVEQLGGEAQATDFITGRRSGRNDACPCGSGRSYKRCHLSQHETLARRIGEPWLTLLRSWHAARAS